MDESKNVVIPSEAEFTAATNFAFFFKMVQGVGFKPKSLIFDFREEE